jgi:hypothetical protein
MSNGPVAPSWLGAVRGLDWLPVLLVSWVLPLGLVSCLEVSYFNSLLFWLIPIACLLPRFLRLTHPGSRRRKAMCWAVTQLFVLGVILDLAFGHFVLLFSSKTSGIYVGVYVPAIGMSVPIEEILFYGLGPAAILLVYFWCDEFWLSRYNPQDRRLGLKVDDRLLRISYKALFVTAALIMVGIVLKRIWDPSGEWVPRYFTFLVVTGALPAVFCYEGVKDLVNWRALSVTVLYVLATSIIWEVTLGVPRRWWGYQAKAMLGKFVEAWSAASDWPFPVEAALVWLAAPLASVFAYEAVKAFYYHPAPTAYRRIFGPAHSRDRNPGDAPP